MDVIQTSFTGWTSMNWGNELGETRKCKDIDLSSL